MRLLYLSADPGVPVLGHKGASVHVRALVCALAAKGVSVVLGLSREPARSRRGWQGGARWGPRALWEGTLSHQPASVAAPQQSRQLRDVDGDPPRLVLGEDLRRQPFGLVASAVDVHERLTVGVAHDVATRNLFDALFLRYITEMLRTCGTLPVDAEFGGGWGFIDSRYPFGTASLAFLVPACDACRLRLPAWFLVQLFFGPAGITAFWLIE